MSSIIVPLLILLWLAGAVLTTRMMMKHWGDTDPRFRGDDAFFFLFISVFLWPLILLIVLITNSVSIYRMIDPLVGIREKNRERAEELNARAEALWQASSLADKEEREMLRKMSMDLLEEARRINPHGNYSVTRFRSWRPQ